MAKIKKQNFSDWYLNNILEAELISYAPVKGSIVFRPYGYKIWEKLQFYLDKEIKALGVENSYFPLLIPESFLKKEKEHFEGFTPEVAVVTYAGGEELKEKLVIRPTSETIMYYYFSEWIRSYRDLPFLVNQWANVIRWEKRPFPFIRNTEFLWQEGHTAHSSHKESSKFALKILSLYEKVYKEIALIYGILGKKSQSERFAGALDTYTYEILLPDGKALQGCTSHDLGQNFSKVFNIRFQDKDKKLKYVWQTSWGFSSRSLGAIVAVHGDDDGLVLPPKLAPFKIVAIPIYDKSYNNNLIDNYLKLLKETFNEDIIIDKSEQSVGYKFNKWDLKGVPLRIEVGSKEVKSNILTCFRRDSRERFKISLEDFKNSLDDILTDIQDNLFKRSKNFVEKNTWEVKSYNDFKKIIFSKRGFIKAFWCQNQECELKIKEETKATTRCLPLDSKEEKGRCIYCNKPSKFRWIFAQSY
jgi:prolyl-tRNA synthetase